MTDEPAPDGWAVLQEASLHLEQDVTRWVKNHSPLILGSGAAAIGLIAALLTIRRFAARLRDRDPLGWRGIFARAVASTQLLFILSGAARVVVNYGNAPYRIAQAFDFIFTVVATFQSAIWVREIILGLFERRAGGDAYGEAVENAMHIIRVAVTFVVYAIAIIVVLDNLGVNIGGLMAGLGIGGLALGIAARGVFEDLFAALSILFDKPFRRGDMVRWDDTQGVIEMIGLRTTRLRALSGEEVIISNANLLNKQLHNLARQEAWRQVFAFGVVYETRPELVSRIPEIVDEVVAAQGCRLLICGLTDLAPSGLRFEAHFDVLTDSLLPAFKAKSDTGMALVRRFAEEGIELAYPTQTTIITGYQTRQVPGPPAQGPAASAGPPGDGRGIDG
jgi:small-conductance mechanosensitive channel